MNKIPYDVIQYRKKVMKFNVGRFLKGDNNKTANSGLYDIFIQK